MSVKQNLIRFLNPVRRIHNDIYSFILAAYLGKIIIVLNQIDHNILDCIYYFFVYSPLGKDIKEFYRVVSSKTMGKKLKWLEEIYNGNTTIINKEIKTSLKIVSTVGTLVDNNTISQMIGLFKILIEDTRNPLIHSNYFLGYGNEYKWKLSYHRTHFNKKNNDFETMSFSIKEAREYLKVVKQNYQKLMKLFFQALEECYFANSNSF